MRKIIAFLFIVLFVTSCSNKKNTFLSRTFHRTTTHYNGFFNAREEMRLADKALWESNDEDWENILPLYIYGAESVYPNMETAIEKCSRAIDRHSIYIKKKEYNSWIDDTYLLMGKAFLYKKNFVKAEEIFKYVEKQYRKEEIRFDANLWMAIMNNEEKNYIKAGSILEKLEEDIKDFPKHFEQWFRQVYAEHYLKQGNYEFAVDELEKAIVLVKNKKRKTRLTFILAQIYDHMGKSNKSIQNFAKVLTLRPDYEMEFYAKINQALAFDARADGREVRGVLNKLLKEKKYAEFKDQIYFALAQIEFADKKNDDGIAYLIKSTEVSVNNDRQKGKSFLSLSEIYFEQRDYMKASGFYDSTITYLPTDYPDYEVIRNTKVNLSELVGHLLVVQNQDSLLMLADLPEKELNKVLRDYIKQKSEERAEKRRLEREQKQNEQARRLEGIDNQRNGTGNNRGGGGGSGAWYFYNPNTKSSGFAEFKRKFGSRRWEDNWKRKDKSSSAPDLDEEDGDLAEEIDDADKIPTFDELKERLPFEDEEKVIANKKISDSMYHIGRIYKEKFEDHDNAIESFEEMSLRYPDEEIIPTVYYQLYILYLKKEEDKNYLAPDFRSTSAYYKTLITDEHSSTEFASILSDPEFQSDKNKRAEEVLENYKNTFRQFRRKNYNEVLVACLDVINNDPSNKLLAKYHLLKAFVIAQKKDRDNYVIALQEVVSKFPGTEEGDEAARLLGLLGETAHTKPKNDNLLAGLDDKDKKKEEKKPDLPKADFSKKITGSHYYAMIVPEGAYDTNELKYKFSDYNKAAFDSEGLKVTSSFLTKETKLILIRTFKKKETAMNYYESAKVNESVLKEINEKGFESCIITSKNFAQLFKSKDVAEYMKFFQENYLN